MTEVREDAVTQLEKHQETMTLHDFVRIAESHHPGEGVERDLLDAYADAVYFDVDVSEIDNRLTGTDEWTEADEFYEMGDDRVSTYPPEWHEALSGTDDILELIELLQAEMDEPTGQGPETARKEGVSEEMVLRVAETIADVDRDGTRDRLKELRKNDEIEEFPSQNRNPWIQVR